MSPLERRYRRLLLLYPAEQRATDADVMVGTLLEAAVSGQRLPSVREALGLLAGGLRARSLLATDSSMQGVWREGVHTGGLGVLGLVSGGVLYILAQDLTNPDFSISPAVPWPIRAGLVIGFVLAVLGLARTALTVLAVCAIGITVAIAAPDSGSRWSDPVYVLAQSVWYWLPVVALAVIHRSAVRRRPSRLWLLLPILWATVIEGTEDVMAPTVVLFVTFGLALGLSFFDPRLAVAGSVLAGTWFASMALMMLTLAARNGYAAYSSAEVAWVALPTVLLPVLGLLGARRLTRL